VGGEGSVGEGNSSGQVRRWSGWARNDHKRWMAAPEVRWPNQDVVGVEGEEELRKTS